MSVHNWQKMFPDQSFQHLAIKNFVGEEDAAVEWEDPEQSASMFFNTKSYIDFKSENVLFLFGRRGTGKTAFIHMFDYEVKNIDCPPYSASWVISTEDSYSDLTMNLRGSPLADYPANDLISYLKKKWKWIFTVTAMQSIYSRLINETTQVDENVRLLEKYLREQKLLNGAQPTHAINRLTEVIQKNLSLVNYCPTKIGLAMANIFNDLCSVNFSRAESALQAILTKQKKLSVVLVDSLDIYDLKDKIVNCVTTALISAAVDFYKERNNKKVIVKIAFPSEIYNELNIPNIGKVGAKTMFITWPYKELVCLLGKRYWKYMHGPDMSNIPDLDDYESAKQFIYEYMPSRVQSEQNVQFDTLAYIIRHTQKKPRQVILLLNIILSIAEKAHIDKSHLPEPFLNKAVHARLEMLIAESFSIYNFIFSSGGQKIDQLIRQVLDRAKSYMDHSDLDSLIGESHSLRTELGLSTVEVKRLLFESGALGVEVGQHPLPNSNKMLVSAVFEYQVKGFLTSSSRANYVVHPMLYQEFSIEVNMAQYVYPHPFETEEVEMLKELGIGLGGHSAAELC